MSESGLPDIDDSVAELSAAGVATLGPESALRGGEPELQADAEAASPHSALHGYESELRADAARRLHHATLRMDRFLLREEIRRLGGTDPTQVLGRTLADEGRRLLRGALRPGCWPLESTLRSAYRLIGALSTLAAWSAPASQESCALNSFPLAAARDVVAYSRYGCAETALQEQVYLATLGFDAAHARLLLTSSGMAAYALIENFLLRDVLKPGDRVLLHPGVYFETQEQVRALPFLDVRVAAGATREQVIEDIRLHQPTLVFVDPLTNSADLRLLDLSQLLADAQRVCLNETWFVVDGTLLSGGFDAFAGQRRDRVRVLYYESGCKYLQFGMDLGPAGLVVIATDLAERFERLRRGIGAVASEPLVLPRASRRAYLAFLRVQTESASAAARAVAAFSEHAGTEVLRSVFPTLATHPDAAQAAAYPHLGGVLVFRFLDARFNRRARLETFIDTLMVRACARQVPLTAGVSFGFRIPRIGAAWSSYDADSAFLRLSAGVDPERAAELGWLIADCAADLVAADAAAR